MILGVGVDIHDIRDMEKNWARYAGAFTAAERELCEARDERMAAYTKRFCAKEACLKALGTNDAQGGVGLNEIEVVPSKSGRPMLRLVGGALRQLKAITPAGHTARINVSISDFFPTACAMVVITAQAI